MAELYMSIGDEIKSDTEPDMLIRGHSAHKGNCLAAMNWENYKFM